MEFKNYKKYKWFFTSTEKLVVGGKNAEQNDELLKKIKSQKKDFVVMHTSTPGSPFCVIIADIKKVTKSDLEETAIFTGCFSKAWKQGKKEAEVDVFRISQLSKPENYKIGLWQVKGKVDRMKVDLGLVLTKQKGIYRAIPEISAKKKDILLAICPGKIEKEKMVDSILEKLKEKKEKRDELLAALPAGGVRVC